MRKGVQYLSWTAAVDESKNRSRNTEKICKLVPCNGTFMLNIKTFLRTNGNWRYNGSIEATRCVVVEAQYMSDQVLTSTGSCNKYN